MNLMEAFAVGLAGGLFTNAIWWLVGRYRGRRARRASIKIYNDMCRERLAQEWQIKDRGES